MVAFYSYMKTYTPTTKLFYLHFRIVGNFSVIPAPPLKGNPRNVLDLITRTPIFCNKYCLIRFIFILKLRFKIE